MARPGGRSLREVLAEEPPLHWRGMLEILGAVCEAVAKVHARGQVHRGLVPENLVLIARPGKSLVELRNVEVVEIGDDSHGPQKMRGSGGPRRRADKGGAIIGDLHLYASPELLMGKPLAADSDLYTLGVIAYELVTGQLPFPEARKGPAAMLRALLKEAPPAPSTIDPSTKIPSSVDAVLLSCLEKDRASRYPDASALARAITEVLATEPPSPPSTARRRAVAAPAPAKPRVVINQIITARPCGAAGCVTNHRVIPAPDRAALGSWMLFDHFDSVVAPRGDIKPHPHAGLATVSYLFEGRLVHRDSLGNVQTLKPGGLNLMSCGTGIVHSERRDPVDAARDARLRGIELWIALPNATEDEPPAFAHHAAAAIPSVVIGGVRVRVVLGEGFGASSPVVAPVPLSLFDVRIPKGAAVPLPAPRNHTYKRAVYVVDGAVEIGGTIVEARSLARLAPDAVVGVSAAKGAPAHILVLGSFPAATRYRWWTFVASTKERIEAAKRRWADDAFGTVPGETERTPLPEV